MRTSRNTRARVHNPRLHCENLSEIVHGTSVVRSFEKLIICCRHTQPNEIGNVVKFAEVENKLLLLRAFRPTHRSQIVQFSLDD